MKNISKFLTSALVVSTLAVSASAAGFAKTQEYPEGKFTDVQSTKWYAAEVKSSYELGFMNGQSDTLFAPEGNVTVAEGITMASRVHAIYNGKTIAEKSGGKWYDMYISYALENGLIKDGQFVNFDRNIMRYEMAVMFANAMPESYFIAKNSIKDIPDVAETEEYYDDLMMLYKAGVVMGSDDYGNFYATNPITRSETAAIINRVALPENRKSGTLLEYGNREQAVFLIDDYKFGEGARGSTNFASGWITEDRGALNFNVSGSILPNMSDSSDKSFVAAHRDIRVQTSGTVKGEIKCSVSGDGASLVFSDSDKEPFVSIVHKNEKIFVLGDKEYDTALTHKSGILKIYCELDIDNNTLFLSVNGKDLGKFGTEEIKDFARFSATTSKESSAGLEMKTVHLYKNYDVYDSFTYTENGEKPYGWTATDNAVVAPVPAAWNHLGGVKITDSGKISKKFSPVGDKFVYETYLLVPKGQPAFVSLMNGGKEAVKVTATADGKFTSANTVLREFDNRVWQCVRIEADTNTNKALIKINGKKCGNVDFNEDTVDEIVIAFEGKGEMLLDNVQLYNVFDYPDYCPVPVAVNDDEWYVGINVCSLWREGTHHGWYCIDGYSDLEPVLGYYDEGLPEVADWEIKFMSEHGYDFQQFCWYVGTQGKEPLKNTRLESALIDGYLNAKYSDMLDFSILWENSNCNFTDSKYFYDVIWPYWCEWFFSDKRYMRIDNKAVLTLYKYDNFMTHMGGQEKAQEVIAFMREDIKRLGYDDMIILFSDRGDNKMKNQMFQSLGGDGIIAYRLHDQDYSLQYEKECMNNSFDAGYLPFLPCVGVGFNDIGWTEERTSMATPEEHESSIKWVKEDYLPRLSGREDAQPWMSKFIFANTWNEYGEGHYISPTGLCGFGYLDGMRKHFSSAAGKNDAKHFDVVPTDNQKARLGYLHPTNHTTMRKLGYEDTKQSVANNRKVLTYNFDSADKCNVWKPSSKISEFRYDEAENALFVDSTGTDDYFANALLEKFVIDADKAKYMKLVVKQVEGKSFTGGAIYFKNEGDTSFQRGKGYGFNVVGNYDGTYSEVIVDLSGNNLWKGIIKEIRIDLAGNPDKFFVKSIEFLEARSSDAFVLNVDDYELDIPTSHVKAVGDEVYIAGNPSKGFYTLQNMYHEWNRNTGVLYIKTSTDTEFVFTVGSNKALVNGVEKALSSEITLYDGLVQIPLCFIYDNSSIAYTKTETGLKIKLRDISYLETIKRVENQWEFNLDGDNEDWEIGNGQGGVANGVIYLTASPTSNGKYDSRIQNSKVAIDTNYHRYVNIRIRAAFDDENSKKELTVYFATAQDKTLNEAKSVKVELSQMQPDDSGFYMVSFDMQTNEKWTGIVNNLRIDPTNYGGFFEFDYIRVEPDEAQKANIDAIKAKKEAEEKAFLAADNGDAFYISNPDAEEENYTATSSNAKITIETDPDNPNNRAYLVTPTNTTTKSWTYIYVPTRFKPGMTYKVEYDIKVIGDVNGNAVQNASITPNFRYTDYASDGSIKTKMDHNASSGIPKISTGDGWVHCTAQHTVSVDSPDRANDYFCIYSNPQGTADSPVNIVFMVDNIVVIPVGMSSLSEEKKPTKPSVQTPPKSEGTTGNAVISFEFNDEADKKRGYAYCADIEVKNGKLCMTATPTASGKYDPQFTLGNLNMDASNLGVIEVRIKSELAEGEKDDSVTIYFATESDTTLNGAKSVKAKLNTLTPDAEGFKTVTFDMKSNENWKGTVTKVRLDPPNSNGYFEIDYIKILSEN